ncbi:MAG TPA: hypothetical protein VGZ22_08780, partial [Isosphaeraceae bacterium]|nr:hypothetical protein [Isosphaeraceae bacterium]
GCRGRCRHQDDCQDREPKVAHHCILPPSNWFKDDGSVMAQPGRSMRNSANRKPLPVEVRREVNPFTEPEKTEPG